MKTKNTSWGGVADWYDGLLEGSGDSFQAKVILPNLIRLVEPRPGMRILDVACGQGYFSRAFAAAGATVVGADISPELIALARKDATVGISYYVAPADSLSFTGAGKPEDAFDAAVTVLALQNIENIAGTLAECAGALMPSGRLFIVMNHPAFRVPKDSSWQWDETAARQYRRIDAYMSDRTYAVDMAPGEKDPARKKTTVSFHRPIQAYFKALNKAGFAVARLEEWISHKQSQKGPRAAEEDRIRKEIPLFLCLECVKKS